jgi:hypothetical protein
MQHLNWKKYSLGKVIKEEKNIKCRKETAREQEAKRRKVTEAKK